MVHVVEREIGGRTLSIETGEIAKQASGSVVVRYGDTAVFCAATFGDPPPHLDFFPLTIDYREKTYAAGKIPGGFFKREGRPTTKEILTCRLMDRPIRPLFPEGFRKDVSVAAMVISADKINDPDIPGMISGFAALGISEIPFHGPVGAVRVGMVDGEFVINPTVEERAEGDLDLVVAGTKSAVTMVECGANEVSESVMLDAIDLGFEVIQEICDMIDELTELAGKEKIEFIPPEEDVALRNQVFELAYQGLKDVHRTPGKHERRKAMQAVTDRVLEEVAPEPEPGTLPDPSVPTRKQVKAILGDVKKKVERDAIVTDERRADNRGLADIRPINTKLRLLPCSHGSALFTRGETQSLVALTLGTSFDEQRVDGLHDEVKETFMLHYNFPAYCVGESWPNRGPKRREIGHGALAERAIRPVLPPHDEFPYTIRIVSDITESNGSSSMASVCGGTLALMDAGVQIEQPVAGIAMGLVQHDGKVCVLSDILGSEDAHGDMDFKVAGTQRGITALQMDIKITGLERNIMEQALEQAREGRIHILREMLTELKRPRADLSPLAPRALRITIDPDKIGLVIGPGGKMIKGIQEETGARIEIEDSGKVTIWGDNQESADAARSKVEMLTEDVKVDQVYKGRVVSIKDFGCFVEVLPGQEGLVHVSELSNSFIESVGDVVSSGDEIEVKVIGIDPQGRIKLSRRVLLDDYVEDSEGGGGDRGGRGGDRGGRGGDRGGRGGDRDRGPRRDRGDRDRGDRDRGPRRDRGDRDRGGRDRDRGDRGGDRGGRGGGGRGRRD